METTNQALLLEKVTNILIGTYDFPQLAKQAVRLIVKELSNEGLIGAAIFRVKNDKLHAYAYATQYRRTIDKILPMRFSELNLALTESENLAIRTAILNQPQQSQKLSDYSRSVLPENLTDKIQKLMKGKLAISFPIRTKANRVCGVILLMLNEDKISGRQLVLFETLANQLGLAFSNVMEFEKLMNKYRVQSDKLNETDKTKIPSLKFTLRITADENKKLEQLAKEKGKTKAEVIREILDHI